MPGGIVLLTNGNFNGGSFNIQPDSWKPIVTVRGMGQHATKYTLNSDTASIGVYQGGRLHGMSIWTPDTFTGSAVKVYGGAAFIQVNKILDDLYIRSDGATGKALHFYCAATAAGDSFITLSSIEFVQIIGFEYGVYLECSETGAKQGFMNDLNFENLTINGSVYCFEPSFGSGTSGYGVIKSLTIQPTVAVTVRGIHQTALAYWHVPFFSYYDRASPQEPCLVDSGVSGLKMFGDLTPGTYLTDNATLGDNQLVDRNTNHLVDRVSRYINPLGIEELFGADVIYPMKDASGSTPSDFSGNRRTGSFSAGTLGSQGRFGKVTFSTLLTGYLKTPVIAQTGQRFFIMGISPDYAYNAAPDASTNDWANWYIDANNSIYLYYHGTTQKLYLRVITATGTVLESSTGTQTFAAGDKLIVTGVIDPTGGEGIKVYINGVLDGSIAFTNNDMSSSTASFFFGNNYAGNNGGHCDIFFAALGNWNPKVTEVLALATKIIRMAGLES